jgi:hypothetical protein
VVARLVVDGRRTPAFTMTTRPPKPIIGEAAAIRQITAASVPPQDISAMDQLVDRYSRGDAGSRRGEYRDRGTGRTGAPS